MEETAKKQTRKYCKFVSSDVEVLTGTTKYTVGDDTLETPTIPTGYKFVGKMMLTGQLIKK